VEYYGLDIHKLSITYTCMNEEGRVLRRGQVATTPEAIREIVAPSGGQAWVARWRLPGDGATCMTPWNPWESISSSPIPSE